jgi:hypothetical protein
MSSKRSRLLFHVTVVAVQALYGSNMPLPECEACSNALEAMSNLGSLFGLAIIELFCRVCRASKIGPDKIEQRRAGKKHPMSTSESDCHVAVLSGARTQLRGWCAATFSIVQARAVDARLRFPYHKLAAQQAQTRPRELSTSIVSSPP